MENQSAQPALEWLDKNAPEETHLRCDLLKQIIIEYLRVGGCIGPICLTVLCPGNQLAHSFTLFLQVTSRLRWPRWKRWPPSGLTGRCRKSQGLWVLVRIMLCAIVCSRRRCGRPFSLDYRKLSIKRTAALTNCKSIDILVAVTVVDRVKTWEELFRHEGMCRRCFSRDGKTNCWPLRTNDCLARVIYPVGRPCTHLELLDPFIEDDVFITGWKWVEMHASKCSE